MGGPPIPITAGASSNPKRLLVRSSNLRNPLQRFSNSAVTSPCHSRSARPAESSTERELYFRKKRSDLATKSPIVARC